MNTEKITRAILLSIAGVGVTVIFTLMCANVWGFISDELTFKLVVTDTAAMFVPLIILVLHFIYKNHQ